MKVKKAIVTPAIQGMEKNPQCETMKTQKYTVKTVAVPKGTDPVGCPVFEGNDKDEIIGFISAYQHDGNISTITLFEPRDILKKIMSKKNLVSMSSKLSDAQMKEDLKKACEQENSPMRDLARFVIRK